MLNIHKKSNEANTYFIFNILIGGISFLFCRSLTRSRENKINFRFNYDQEKFFSDVVKKRRKFRFNKKERDGMESEW